MITHASQLLELFIKEETRKLKDICMQHMPTLGSAYEEVTKQGVDKSFSIPKFLDLSVVSGFISVNGVMLPEQIDCMLVQGKGEKYGLTEQYIYPIDQVLCVFEVKKTLRKKDFLGAFEHLGKIRKAFAEHFETKLENSGYEPDISIACKHYSQITGKAAPEKYMGIRNLSRSESLLFYTLVQETLAPVSIIHGYEGYKTENGLRTAFIDIIEKKHNNGGTGLGVSNLPTLVTSNQFCLVKCNGVPFLSIKDKNNWVAISSTRYNSAKMILELLWSKISLYFGAKMPWDDGLEMDSLQPLLVALPKETKNAGCWFYKARKYKEKYLERKNDNSWTPSVLDQPEMASVLIMAMRGGYLPLDHGMKEYLKKEYNVMLDEVAENLLLTREFMRDGEYIRPINNLTLYITKSDKTGFVSSEEERFDIWCTKNNIEPNYVKLLLVE